jgi:hypothetical protein
VVTDYRAARTPSTTNGLVTPLNGGRLMHRGDELQLPSWRLSGRRRRWSDITVAIPYRPSRPFHRQTPRVRVELRAVRVPERSWIEPLGPRLDSPFRNTGVIRRVSSDSDATMIPLLPRSPLPASCLFHAWHRRKNPTSAAASVPCRCTVAPVTARISRRRWEDPSTGRASDGILASLAC